MTQKNELERMLSQIQAPPPPAGLADRLKHDIPLHLGAARPVEWRGTRLRVAAAALLLLGAGAAGWRYLRLMPNQAPMARSTGAVAAMSVRPPRWNSYEVARQYLTRGDIPPAAAISVDDLLRTFSYADPASAALYAETAGNPFVQEPDSYLMLVGSRGTQPPAYPVDVAFDRSHVLAYDAIGGENAEQLYALRLNGAGQPGDIIATLTVHDQAGESRTLHRAELSSGWNEAPRGVKLASVVAMWGEVLKQTTAGRRIDVNTLAAKAAEVSREFQQDAKVNELARLIETTRRLQGVS